MVTEKNSPKYDSTIPGLPTFKRKTVKMYQYHQGLVHGTLKTYETAE